MNLWTFLHPVSLSNKILEGSSFQTKQKQKQKQNSKKAVNHFERARFFSEQPNETIKENLQHFNNSPFGKICIFNLILKKKINLIKVAIVLNIKHKQFGRILNVKRLKIRSQFKLDWTSGLFLNGVNVLFTTGVE